MVFLQPQKENKVCRNDSHSVFQRSPSSGIALQAVEHHQALTEGGSGEYTQAPFQVCLSPGHQVTSHGTSALGSSNPTTVCDGPSPGGQLGPEHNPATQQRATDPLPGWLLAQADTEAAGKLRCHTASYSVTARPLTCSCSLPIALRDCHSLTGSKSEGIQTPLGKCESTHPGCTLALLLPPHCVPKEPPEPWILCSNSPGT